MEKSREDEILKKKHIVSLRHFQTSTILHLFLHIHRYLIPVFSGSKPFFFLKHSRKRFTADISDLSSYLLKRQARIILKDLFCLFYTDLLNIIQQALPCALLEDSGNIIQIFPQQFAIAVTLSSVLA